MSTVSVYSNVRIIFNPNSTGESESEAKALAATLTQGGVADVEMLATARAGHATELAYESAKVGERPLIVSASGDGGYNEVINGALRAQREGAHPVCAVLAAGNANDHSRTVLTRPLAEAILDGQIKALDVLRLDIASGAESVIKYAHSYVGLGLTPTVAVELNRTSLNHAKELYIALKAFKDLQAVTIEVNSRKVALNSLVIANISQMAKVLTIASNAAPDDGLMRITTFPHAGKLRLIGMLAKAAIVGVKGRSALRYSFTTTTDTPIQFDGEVYELKAGDHVRVSVASRELNTVY